jgi:hypothetical protein
MSTKAEKRGIILGADQVRSLLDEGKCTARVKVKCPKWLERLEPDFSKAFPDRLWGATPGLHVPVSKFSPEEPANPDDGIVERLHNPWDFFDVEGAEPVYLYVREAWYRVTLPPEWRVIYYRATDLKPNSVAWRSAATIPERYSRITVRIQSLTAVREGDRDWVWDLSLKRESTHA